MPKRNLSVVLRESLFRPGLDIYVVLDGASIKGLLNRLVEFKAEFVCLYRGDLAPDLAEMAPYLVRLQHTSKITDWIIQDGWGQHWGIYSASKADLKTMRKHFRTFLKVESPEGKPIYFRFYDPRVMRNFLPTCNSDELKTIFGPIEYYAVEGEEIATFLRFINKNDKLIVENISLNA